MDTRQFKELLDKLDGIIKDQVLLFGNFLALNNTMLDSNLATDSNKENLEGYILSTIDDTSSIVYKGYIRRDGNWFIKQVDDSVTNITITKYIKGGSDFSTNWTNRVSLTYNYIDNI